MKVETPSHGLMNTRSKKDIAWDYVGLGKDEEGKNTFTCSFCKKTFKGGGINRIKQHLAGIVGNIISCKKVDADVKNQMLVLLTENSQKIKLKSSDTSESCVPGLGDEDGECFVEVETINTQEGSKKDGKRKAPSCSQNLQSFFKRGIHDSSQPTVKSAMQSKKRLLDTDLAIAMWFYDACIPMNAINSPLFPIALSKIASIGHGYSGPSYHALRVGLLRDAKECVRLIVDLQRSFWEETGCTIMSDGWRDTRQRPLINFLVYCPKGTSFIRSVDASDIVCDSNNLCNLFGEIVEIVGPKNVVHLVTDNAANYKAAGNKLCERYPTICWSPCVAHCINLILKDMGELTVVSLCVASASAITVFIYNHKWPLNWLRKRPGWTEIIRPGATRFGTMFIALQSLYNHKHDLQALVTSAEYKKILKYPKAIQVRTDILDEHFWNSCIICVKTMAPILRLLRLCDSDEKPALGYVYEGMYRARKSIKHLFRNKKISYKPYTDIIDARWDKMLRKSLHCAAYWLNPVFQYDQANFCKKKEVHSGVLDMIEHKATDNSTIISKQLIEFRERLNNFGRPLAMSSCKVHRPDEWWKLFGGDVPELQKFAVRILSQTAASSGCERNWSVFERIHTKKRNRLEHKRLDDLIYVHYNLRLQNRNKYDKRCYDPVDYECINQTEFWVVEEEPSGELNIDELENHIQEEPPIYDDPSTTKGKDIFEDNDNGMDEELEAFLDEYTVKP